MPRAKPGHCFLIVGFAAAAAGSAPAVGPDNLPTGRPCPRSGLDSRLKMAAGPEFQKRLGIRRQAGLGPLVPVDSSGSRRPRVVAAVVVVVGQDIQPRAVVVAVGAAARWGSQIRVDCWRPSLVAGWAPVGLDNPQPLEVVGRQDSHCRPE